MLDCDWSSDVCSSDLYTPCLSTVAAIRQESKSTRLAALSVLLPLALAWVVSFAFYQGARALGF
jgi:ferrous iron transport protein B